MNCNEIYIDSSLTNYYNVNSDRDSSDFAKAAFGLSAHRSLFTVRDLRTGFQPEVPVNNISNFVIMSRFGGHISKQEDAK